LCLPTASVLDPQWSQWSSGSGAGSWSRPCHGESKIWNFFSFFQFRVRNLNQCWFLPISWLLNPIRIRFANTDPHPEMKNQCGSTRIRFRIRLRSRTAAYSTAVSEERKRQRGQSHAYKRDAFLIND
jgi:hypothetical protein